MIRKTLNLMRKTTAFAALTLALVVFATVSSADQVQKLYAGQNIEVGTVTVSDDGNQITVAYETTGDWYIAETHVHIGETKEDIPQTKSGNPKVGNFASVQSYDPPVQIAALTFNISELDSQSGCFFIAAHASVVRLDGSGDVVQQETAWANGDRFTDRGSWATYFEYCLQLSPPEVDCETAFAYGGEAATSFLDMGDFNRWGWSNGSLEEGTYEFDIYAGAGQSDLSKGTLVGTLIVDYSGGTATVTYQLNNGFTIEETHLYVGSEPLPRDVRGEFTVAPGQYPYIHKDLNGATTDTYTVDGLPGDIYIVAHAVVCGDYDSVSAAPAARRAISPNGKLPAIWGALKGR